MRKVWYILLGLVLVGVGAGALYYRYMQNPEILSRYESIITGEKEAEPPPPPAKKRSASPADDQLERYAPGGGEPSAYGLPDRSHGFSAFEVILDVLNVLVGLIGIVLTFTGMRMRRAGGA